MDYVQNCVTYMSRPTDLTNNSVNKCQYGAHHYVFCSFCYHIFRSKYSPKHVYILLKHPYYEELLQCCEVQWTHKMFWRNMFLPSSGPAACFMPDSWLAYSLTLRNVTWLSMGYTTLNPRIHKSPQPPLGEPQSQEPYCGSLSKCSPCVTSIQNKRTSCSTIGLYNNI
jgi:hypothetical protein